MNKKSHLTAVFQALLVTFLWSTSWIIIKWFVNDIPPLTFAGIRYFLAFLILLPGLFKYRKDVAKLEKADFIKLLGLGLIYYTIAQGAQFFTLKYLDTVTFSLILNFTSPIVALAGFFFLKEHVSRWQLVGLGLFILGSYLYFQQGLASSVQGLGFLLALITLLANAASSVMSRMINKDSRIHPLIVTSVSMGFGSVVLLSVGITSQGIPAIRLEGWLAIFWLAVFNTAAAFVLWNKSLQTLTALQSSLINSTMMIQIALLSTIFLSRALTVTEIIGLALSFVATVIVNTSIKQK